MAACRLCHPKDLSQMNSENKAEECEKNRQINNKKKGLNSKRLPLEAIDNIECKKIKLAAS